MMFKILEFLNSFDKLLSVLVQTLHCFTCSAYNGDICKANQQYHSCTEENPTCLTLTYKSLLNGKERTYFQKKCINGSSKCETNCQNLQDSHGCMVSKIAFWRYEGSQNLRMIFWAAICTKILKILVIIFQLRRRSEIMFATEILSAEF